jgi:hypothetical protein
MHSRVWVGIVLIGVLGVVILGFLTKFAIDSNAGLRDVIRFKTAFAREFETAGFEDVSLRRRPGGSGYALVLTCSTPSGSADPAVLDRRIAEYFVENFSDGGARVLEISYVLPTGFGCRSEEPFRTQEVALGGVRSHLELRGERARLEATLRDGFGSRLLSDRFEGRNIVVEVEAQGEASGDLRGFAGRIEPSVRERFRVQPYAQLILRVRAPRGPNGKEGPGEIGSEGATGTAGFVEVRYDPKGREVAR